MGTIEKDITQKGVQNALESLVKNVLFQAVNVEVAVIKNNIKFVQKQIKNKCNKILLKPLLEPSGKLYV